MSLSLTPEQYGELAAAHRLLAHGHSKIASVLEALVASAPPAPDLGEMRPTAETAADTAPVVAPTRVQHTGELKRVASEVVAKAIGAEVAQVWVWHAPPREAGG